MKKIKNIFFVIILIILNTLIPLSKVYGANEIKTIQFQDKNLYTAIIQILENGSYNKDIEEREKIEIVEKDENKLQIKLRQEDIEKVTNLDLSKKGIKNIAGIENFKNLEVANFFNEKNAENKNEISDISYLQNLTNLTYICLDYNKVTDISYVKNLKQLKILDLCYNPLQEDISVIEDLSNLEEIWLMGTGRTKLPDMSKFTKLVALYIGENEIEDISQLKNLNNLKTVNFVKDNITKEVTKNGIQEIALPSIFADLKNENTIYYTENDYELQNCTLSEDKRSILIDTDKVRQATIKLKKEYNAIEDGEIIVAGDVTLRIRVKDKVETKPEQNTIQENTTKPIEVANKVDNTQSKQILPKTGNKTNIIVGISFIIVLIMIGSYIQYIKYKKIK